mgnify:CR=1 FL=1
MPQIINPVTFNGTSLTSITGVTVLSTNPYLIPKRNVTFGQITRTNKSKVNSGFYSDRNIIVKVGISMPTRELMQQSLDSLMTILQPLDKELILNQGSTTRKYYATLIDAPASVENNSYQELDLTFYCSDRFGYDTTASNLKSIPVTTTSTLNYVIAFSGSAEWQVPVITLNYSVITGGTSKSVLMGNNSVGQAVTVNRTWSASDSLVVDSFNKTVKVNGVDVVYTGAIPEFKVGNQTWYYADEFTTRSFTGSITCVSRYV